MSHRSHRILLQDIVVQVSRDGQTGSGTGFYITKDLVVTCYHVLVKQGTSGPLQDKYWIRHGDWEAWEQAEPKATYCHPQPHDTAILRCSRSTSGTVGVCFADWNKDNHFHFASRGYEATKNKWGVGASTIEGEVFDVTELNRRPRLRLKTEAGTVVSGRSGSPVWSQEHRAIVGLIDWVGQELGPGRGDEVLAIPISDIIYPASDEPHIAEKTATIKDEIEDLYLEPGKAITGPDGERPLARVLAPRPQRHPPFVDHSDLLDELKRRLMSEENEDIAITYLPGVGKSALALELAWDEDVRKHFFDGVLWAPVGTDPDLRAILNKWARFREIQEPDIEGMSDDDLAQVIGGNMRDRSILLVLDHAWDVEKAKFLQLGGPNCAHLITTRKPDIVPEFGAKEVLIPELDEDDAVKLMQEIVPEAVREEPEEVMKLIKEDVGGLPQALILMGRYLAKSFRRGHTSGLKDALKEMRQTEELLKKEDRWNPQRNSLPEVPLALFAIIRISDEALDEMDEEARRTFRALSVFRPKPNTFTAAAAEAVCQASEQTLRALVGLGLIDRAIDSDDRYTLPRLVAFYSRIEFAHVSDETAEELHQHAVTYYGGLLSSYDDEHPELTSYERWYRYEDPEWQDTKASWLYHLEHLADVTKVRVKFARVYFDAFYWWGWYYDSPFCRQLLEDWAHARKGREKEDEEWLNLLRQFQESYPTGYEKRDKPGWGQVKKSLDGIRKLTGLNTDLSTLTDPDLRYLRAITDILLANAHHYQQIEDLKADECYEEALGLFIEREGEESMHIPWIRYHQGDLYLARGQQEKAAETCNLSLCQALNSTERILKRDCEVIANNYRVLGDKFLQAGDLDAAFQSYALALSYAYAFQGVDGPDLYTLAFYREMKERSLGALRDVRRETGTAGFVCYLRDFSYLLGTGGGQQPPSLEDMLVESYDGLEAYLFPQEPEEAKLNDPNYCEEYKSQVEVAMKEMAPRIEEADKKVRESDSCNSSHDDNQF